MRRQKILGLYRQFFRLTRQLENDQQKRDTREWIRSEFRAKLGTQDKVAFYIDSILTFILKLSLPSLQELIEMHLSNGQNALRDLENSLRHAHALKSK